MNTQAFIHETKPDPSRIDPIGNPGGDRGGILVKPIGGFWTSTYMPAGDFMCDWHRWCFYERWGLTEDSVTWKLEPRDDVNVRVIDSEVDFNDLLDEFARTDSPVARLPKPNLDFEAIAEEYDGLRLTAKGQKETRFTNPGLNGWDCESTVWFDWVFTDVRRGLAIGKDYQDKDAWMEA